MKNSDGLYETSTLGKAMLNLLPSLQFLFKHRNYIISHDLSFLPKSFAERIGELSGGKLLGHFNTVLEHIKTTISQAKKFVWLIADEPVVPTTSMGIGFPSATLPVRLILGEGYSLKEFSMAKSQLPSKFEIALARNVRIAMAINEKIAGVCFPQLGGKIDFGVGFIGSDPEFLSWCQDLFEHYWSTAEPTRF